MLPNAFIGWTGAPGDPDLTAALGSAKPLWDGLVVDLTGPLGLDGQEWHSYSKKAGWALRLKRGKRVIVYLSPGRGGFLASFALGGKAVEAAKTSGLDAEVLRAIDVAPRYAEGAGVRIEVSSEADCAAVKALAAVKLSH